MPLEDILVHTGVPYREEASGTWIEGEFDTEPVRLTPFDCVLFLPQGREDQGGPRARKISQPTLLYGPTDRNGQAIDLSADDELFVTAAELAPYTGAVEVKWKVDGAPQPAGYPGDEPVVVQARLVKVDD